MRSGPRPSRRRAALFAALAAVCAALSAAAAARRDANAADGLGRLQGVVVVESRIERGTKITARLASRALAVQELPERFLPPDRLGDPTTAIGARTVGEIPAGSYLLASQLRRGAERRPSRPPVGHGLRPVEVVVTGGPEGAAALPRPGSRVDVLAAEEPGSTSNPRVRVLARRVPLIGLDPLRGDAAAAAEAASAHGSAGAPASWLATLALDHRTALAVIEADNYAREVRLLAR